MSDEDRLKGWFDKYGDDYVKFDRIPADQRRHRRADVCAFIYLDEKLGGGEGDAVSAAEHDEIFLTWENLADLSEEDVLYITRCGVRYNEGDNCLAMWV